MAGRRVYESLASAAERTGLSSRTLRRRIAEGVLPVYRCGRILRVVPEEVDAMLEGTWRQPLRLAQARGRSRRPA